MLALAKPYQLKRHVVDDVSKHGIEAIFMALTHQDHRIHRFSSTGLTKTKKERKTARCHGWPGSNHRQHDQAAILQ